MIGLPLQTRVEGVGRHQHEKMVKAMIEMFWGDLFSKNGDTTHCIKKETVDGGMRNGVWYICEKMFKRAIKLLKENKATMRVVW